MNKVIFLDFDGVMMCGRHAFPSPYHQGFEFYPKSVENLKKIIRQTGAKIVVTSSYRRFDQIDIFKKCFFAPYELENHFMGVTPKMVGGRRQEIQTFIEENAIQNFVIIDDQPIDGFGERFLRTHPFEGIAPHHVITAVKLLKGE